MSNVNYKFHRVSQEITSTRQKKDCEIVIEWTKSIINHMYWCAMSTPSANSDLIKAKWLSIVNHIHNKHKHEGIFKNCGHKRIHGHRKKWFHPRKCT